MCRPEHNVPQNVVVFGFDAEPFKTTPVPCWVQVRREGRCASQESPRSVLLKSIFSVLEPKPVTTGHVRPINRKPQVIGRVPSGHRLFDIAHIEVTSALRTDSVAL